MMMPLSCDRSQFCRHFFYGLFEVMAFLLVATVVTWYAQSKEAVVNFDDIPGYRIIQVAEKFIEVKWVNAALVIDCPGHVEPIFVGELGSFALESYPFVVEHSRKTFTRRYPIPDYFIYGEYELRINMVARCNPLFETRQVLRVPFVYRPELF